MSRRAAWIAWAAWALALTLSAAGLVLLALNRGTPVGTRWGPPGFPAIFAVVFSTVGVLIAHRRPENLIAWLFCLVGLLSGVQVFTDQYGVYAVLTRPGSLPAGVWFAWLQSWIWILAAVPAWVFLPMLFPQGHLAAPRWRVLAWLGLFGILISITGYALRPGPLENFVRVTNPLGIGEDRRPLDAIWAVGYVVVALVTLAAAIGLIVRLRRSTGETRAQLKWFVYAIIFLAVMVPIGTLPSPFGQLLLIAATAGVPISVGIAILRYRLYDIDLIIRRTLIYALISGVLALVYFGSVVLFQLLFRTLTGSAAQSQLAIVASTLAIAALFAPLRRQAQDFIDRRFYRRKYDAARTLAEFAATARDETNLEMLAGRLVNVVEETMQPANVSLWLAAQGGSPRTPAGTARE